MNKEELIKKMKDIGFEECQSMEAIDVGNSVFYGNKIDVHTRKGFLCLIDENGDKIYFKPVEQFPIIFEGENMNFEIRLDNDKIPYLFINSQRYYNLEEKDIEANKKALDKLEELKNGKM